MNVCCTTLLSSELVGPTCVQARSSTPRSRVCKEGIGGGGDMTEVVPIYLYCPAFSVSIPLDV